MKTRKVSWSQCRRLASTMTIAAFAAAILLTISPVAHGVVTHWYKLDETTGTTASDSAFSGDDGTLQNGSDFSTDSVTGVFGNALKLDEPADHYIDIPNSSTLPQAQQSRTIMAWVQSDDDWQSHGIWTAYNLNDIEWSIGTLQGSGTMLWRYKDDLTDPDPNDPNNPLGIDSIRETELDGTGVGGVNITGDPNAFHHFAMTLDPNGIDTVYIDGNAVAPDNTTNGWGAGNAGFSIGRRNNSRHWDGAIDEFAIFQGKLGQSQIQNIMANGVPEPSTVTLLLMGLVFGAWGLFHRRSRRRR